MTVLRIGRPPRLPLRVRRARLLNQIGRYALAWAVVGVATFWLALGDSLSAIALLAIAAFIAAPRWTPKTRTRRSALSRGRVQLFPLLPPGARDARPLVTSPGE